MFVQETELNIYTRGSVECLYKRQCCMFVQETVLNVCTIDNVECLYKRQT